MSRLLTDTSKKIRILHRSVIEFIQHRRKVEAQKKFNSQVIRTVTRAMQKTPQESEEQNGQW